MTLSIYEPKEGEELHVTLTELRYTFAHKQRANKILVFKAIYMWSHKQFFWVCENPSNATILNAVSECFIRCGMPKKLVVVNTKYWPLVSGKDNNLEPHSDLQSLCESLGVECEARNGQRGGLLNQASTYLQKLGLNHLNFGYPDTTSVPKLNEALQDWTTRWSDRYRYCDVVINDVRKRRKVCDAYAHEREHLKFIERDELMKKIPCNKLTKV